MNKLLRTIEFAGFDWTAGNINKVQKHKVSISEIEALFSEQLLIIYDEKHSYNEERFIAVGETKTERLLFVSFTNRKKDTQTYIRVISARYIHSNSREREFYEKLKKKI